MYILFERLWDYEINELNIIAIYEDEEEIYKVLAKEEIVRIRGEYTGRTFEVKDHKKDCKYRELSLIEVTNNSILNKPVAI